MLGKTKFLIAAASTIGVLGGGTGVVMASDDAKPGDALYAFDKLGESVEKAVTFSEDAKADLEMDILDERMQELKDINLNEIADDKVEEAIETVKEQQARVVERTEQALNAPDNDQAQERERIENRYEEQIQQHTQEAAQIQEKMQQTGKAEAAGKMQENIKNFQNSSQSQKGKNN